jgi:hypothetical protein
LAYIGVAINAFIISFTSGYFEKAYLRTYTTDASQWAARLAFILIFEHAVLAVHLIVSSFLPEPSKKVRVALQRWDYTERLIRGEMDGVGTETLVHLRSVKVN